MFGIKPASTNDISLIQELNLKVWPQTYSTLLSGEQIKYMLDLMYSETSLTQQMTEGSNFIILYEDDTPVGFASYQDIGASTWKLHKIYILPSLQGKGAGRYMIDHIIGIIKQNKGESLQLQVNRKNKAKEFYERLGFSVINELDLDIGNGFFMKDYIMEKKI